MPCVPIKRKIFVFQLNFIIKLNKKSKSGKYRYKINKTGIVAYLQYKRRIENGFDLNLHKRFPELVDSYSGITQNKEY